MWLPYLALARLPSPLELAAGQAPPRAHAPVTYGARAAPPPDSLADALGAWDVQDVLLRVRIDTDERQVEGHATLRVRRLGAGDLVLHADGPVVTSVTVDGQAVTPRVVGDELHLEDPGGDTTVDVRWTWGGPSDPAGGLQWGRTTFSFHEPEHARRWLVLRDIPADKFTLTWQVDAPADQVVAANGELQSRAALEDGFERWIWRFDAPIPTYLAAVHVSDYEVLELGGDIPVRAWVHPEQVDDARDTFATTGDMLDYFAERYNPYLFTHYGNAAAPFGGAMEHTTVTTFGEDLLGSDWGEIVNAHELGHHWWGDDVTLAGWEDIWLNEGFASYTEVLWYERTYGDEGRVAYTEYQTGNYLRGRDREGYFSLYDPDYLWGGTVYDKGALVLHQLRGVLGDEVFFDVLRAYEARHRLGVAATEDFITAAEATSGQPLRWYFDPWVFLPEEPSWRWSWGAQPAGAGWQVDLAIAQDLPDFRVPTVARVRFADGTEEDVALDVSGDGLTVTLCRDAEPVEVTLDPDGWWPLVQAREVVGANVALTCGDDPDTGGADTAADPGTDDPADTVVADEDASEGCGCASGGAPSGLGALVLAGLMFRRRR